MSEASGAADDDGELPLEEDRAFQERFWTLERWAWAVYGLVVLVAAVGLTGAGGPLARTTADLGGGSIEYPRVSRWQTADMLVVTFARATAERRTLTLSPGFAEAFQLAGTQPPAVAAAASSDGDELIFAVPAGETATVRLHLRANQPELARYLVRIDGGEGHSLSTLVLP